MVVQLEFVGSVSPVWVAGHALSDVAVCSIGDFEVERPQEDGHGERNLSERESLSDAASGSD